MSEGRTIVYLRFPFPRNGFKDPQKVEWSETKEKALWNHLNSQNFLEQTNINWEDLSTRFNAPIEFLEQQCLWMYRHRLAQLKAIKTRRLDKLRSQSKDAGDATEFDFSKLFKPEYHDSILAQSVQERLEKSEHNTASGNVISDRSERSEVSMSSSSPGVDDITAHLHSSRILSAKVPKFDDSDDDIYKVEEEEEEEEYDDDEKERERNGEEGGLKSPLLNHIKFLASKYR